MRETSEKFKIFHDVVIFLIFGQLWRKKVKDGKKVARNVDANTLKVVAWQKTFFIHALLREPSKKICRFLVNYNTHFCEHCFWSLSSIQSSET